MAKLPDHKFSFKSQSDERLDFTSSVSVDSQGLFHVSIPESLEQTALRIMVDDQQRNSVSRKYPGAQITRPRDSRRVSAPTLATCHAFIAAVAEDFLRCDVKHELMIVYWRRVLVAYFKTGDGALFANGLEVRAAGYDFDRCGGQWHGELHGGSGGHAAGFSVGLAANVRVKTTYTRPSGTKVVYNRPDNLPDGSWGQRLNGFIGYHLDPQSRSYDRDERAGTYDEIPYTEDGAAFFYRTILSMITLADRIEGFFGDPTAVTAAIEQRREGFTLAAPSTTPAAQER